MKKKSKIKFALSLLCFNFIGMNSIEQVRNLNIIHSNVFNAYTREKTIDLSLYDHWIIYLAWAKYY